MINKILKGVCPCVFPGLDITEYHKRIGETEN